MSDINQYTHIVEFQDYCEKCKHYETNSYDLPCRECVENPLNYGTHRPLKFELDETKAGKKQ